MRFILRNFLILSVPGLVLVDAVHWKVLQLWLGLRGVSNIILIAEYITCLWYLIWHDLKIEVNNCSVWRGCRDEDEGDVCIDLSKTKKLVVSQCDLTEDSCFAESHFKDNPALSMLNDSDEEVHYSWVGFSCCLILLYLFLTYILIVPRLHKKLTTKANAA